MGRNDSWGQILLDRIADSERRLDQRLAALEAGQIDAVRQLAADMRAHIEAASQAAAALVAASAAKGKKGQRA